MQITRFIGYPFSCGGVHRLHASSHVAFPSKNEEIKKFEANDVSKLLQKQI